jgi:alkaline phosphatase D
MKRRDFLRNAGWFVAGATLAGIPGCSDATTPIAPPDAAPGDEPVGTYSFPQGVASGDPQATSVVLWTRAVLTAHLTNGLFSTVLLRVQVSASAGFGTMIVDKAIVASQNSDNTVRVLITDLAPATTYYYRFVAGKDVISGRTLTAPAATADVPVNFAWVSCQDYGAGHYGAYRQLMIDDDARADADKIHAVIHLGDMIYETRADGFQGAIDDSYNPIMLTNRDGHPRVVDKFPSATADPKSGRFATTVDDYRHLYKTFFSDPDIQAARARWPFIAVWDDHEFTDDCWQSQANYTNDKTLDEPSQPRRVAASQAWFEYVPALLTGAGGVKDVDAEAADFASVAVKVADFTAPNDDNFVDEPNNADAIGAITIYRSLRFGKHVELVMTDLRSYRSDHAVPEDIIAMVGPPLFFAPRNVLPLPLVNTFDQGKTANGGSPPQNVFGLIPNVRATSPVGTMLGKKQKAWWKATMKGSDATWKLWGNEVTLMRLRIPKLGAADPADRVLAADSWDGYPTERAELMTYLKTEAIDNVVVLSGDIHASFAGTIMDDFDAASPTPVACELVAPGISSNSLFSFFEFATRAPADPALRALITVNATAKDGPAFTENFNMLLLHGTVAAGTFAQAVATPNVTFAQAIGAGIGASIQPNPHLKYIDSNSQGYGYVKITADQIDGSIVTINRPIAAPSDAGPGIKRTASFTIPKANPGGMTGPTVTGTKPFPT